MSEPLSSSDIEDVVSSVRRLVSPEARPRAVSRDLGLDRLILTPSFRITADPAGSGSSVVKLEAVAKKSRGSTKRTKTRMIASVIPPMVMGEDGSEILPPDPELAGTTDTMAMPDLGEAALAAEEAVVLSTEPAVDKTVPAEKKATATSTRRKAAGEKAPAKARSAKSSKTLGEMPEEMPAKKRKPTAKAASKPVDTAKSAAVEALDTDTSLPAEAILAPEPEADPVVAVAADEVHVAAELAVEARVSDPLEPGTPPEVDPPTTAAPALTDVDGTPISILDEEQLILLLRRVIREELQGGLGEKITRNVRKLVRAEINRALTAETLE